jgi:hypothetical protein
MQDECYLSLHAMSGQPQHKVIQLRALVQNQALIILIDSGSSHTFLNIAIANKLQVQKTAIPALSVRVANGASLPCTSEVKKFDWWIQGLTFAVDAKIMDMGAYDLVLGMDWLEQFTPMTYDWLHKWIEFQYHNTTVRLQGIKYDHQQPQELQEISIEQVLKWEKGNDLWAMVMVQPSSKSTSLQDEYLLKGIPDQIKDLIFEYDILFQVPSVLPPSRLYDHAITLLPNSAPVNSRPYRYSPE